MKKRILILAALILGYSFIFSQDMTSNENGIKLRQVKGQFAKGTIVDSIAVGNVEGETFALYLPDSFNEQNLSPIVFVFDPSGNGSLGVKPFIKASEKYGLIIICSNNSKNGSYNQNFNIFNNLFSCVYSLFKIKRK